MTKLVTEYESLTKIENKNGGLSVMGNQVKYFS